MRAIVTGGTHNLHVLHNLQVAERAGLQRWWRQLRAAEPEKQVHPQRGVKVIQADGAPRVLHLIVAAQMTRLTRRRQENRIA